MSTNGNGWEALAKMALQTAGIYVKVQEDLEPICRLPGRKVIRVDLLIPPNQLNEHPGGLAISVKGQTASGTADEKLWFHLDKVIPATPCPVLLVMPGSGWHEDWILLAKQKADGVQLIKVLTSIDQLYEWALAARDKGQAAEFALYKVLYADA